jgi:hypothetical protein
VLPVSYLTAPIRLPGVDLDLAQDAAALTACLVDVASVSGAEKPLADAIAGAVQALPHLSCTVTATR